MAGPTAMEPVRITKIAGRYLVFDLKGVSALRRNHNICAVFVGTTPQNPTQNIFQGLPIELLAEEAKILVEKNAAYIVDDVASHLARLSSFDEPARKAYAQSLRNRRRVAQNILDEEEAKRRETSAQKKARSISKKASKTPEPEPGTAAAPAPAPEDELFPKPDGPSPKEADAPPSAIVTRISKPVNLTPTTSADMIDPTADTVVDVDVSQSYPLVAHLNSRGYYTTPGIRFGGDLSVYPGDPFRYHAHFIATSFGWDEEITILDLVSGGRLGTAVKKGFLFGGEAPGAADGKAEAGDRVRTFTLEWAGM
ncbi:tRNA-splicing endonuclease subunit Sen34 [Pleurostoma richardsiae]|uniref:tRNA-splicing endonuclease subunit Sen34 n=1 Tax=Pleurostoma richardsiae TaxID=41990 RepID=A0AA38S8N5_9PEZI|nr:tRNA-splicing endonuclease subunit Sen34 [Pleurostoma richardsiae]